MFLCLVTCLAVVSTAAADHYAPATNAWRPTFTLPVSDGRVEAMYVWRDQLVVAGSFTQIGGVYSPGVATWDGSSWHALGHGLTGDANGVHVVALSEFRGDLVVGGLFYQAGDSLASGIARWDGAMWHPLGDDLHDGGADIAVRALAVYHDELIAGGYFVHTGGVPSFKHIAAFDGTAWRALGAPPDNEISALTVWNDQLIAGGYFAQIGDSTAARIAAWNGSHWAAMSGGFNYGAGFYHGVTDLLPYQDGVLAVGRFVGTHDGAALHIALYTSRHWTPLLTSSLPMI